MNISIAMATYNGARFLDQQLASLASQTKQPFEVVVCDDGSTDTTVEILKAWAATVTFPVHIYQNAQRLGHEDNFWKAAHSCMGELIAFCDQDDVWMENKLQCCAEVFSDSDILLAIHSAILVDANLRSLGKNLPDIPRSRVANSLDVNPWHSAPGFAIVFSSKLLHCGDWEKRPKDHLGHGRLMGHDHWVYFMASVLGRTAFLPDPLALYRRHQNNTTTPVDRTVKTFVKRGMDTGEEAYKKMSCLSQERSDYLSRLSEQADDETKTSYQGACVYYRKLSDTLNLRASIHSAKVELPRKMSYVLKMLLGKAYRSVDRGGLGARAFAKDLLFSIARH